MKSAKIKQMSKITKAIIPAAGLGTRFLPQTKAMPKEMLPIIDKPVIQYVVEEAVSAGITDIIIVTGAHKRPIEDHFDHQYELERQLAEKGKTDLATQLAGIADMANFIYIRQKGHAGNGTPILNAAHLVDDEPFLVLFGDDMVRAEKSRAQQLIETYDQYKKSVLSLVEVPGPEISNYGVVDPGDQVDDKTYEVKGLVEKPTFEDAPSKLAAISGYVLTPDIFPVLSKQEPDDSGEVYLPVAINQLAQAGKVYGRLIEGRWHDIGNKERYLEAIVETALADNKLGAAFKSYLEKILGKAK